MRDILIMALLGFTLCTTSATASNFDRDSNCESHLTAIALSTRTLEGVAVGDQIVIRLKSAFDFMPIRRLKYTVKSGVFLGINQHGSILIALYGGGGVLAIHPEEIVGIQADH